MTSSVQKSIERWTSRERERERDRETEKEKERNTKGIQEGNEDPK